MGKSIRSKIKRKHRAEKRVEWKPLFAKSAAVVNARLEKSIRIQVAVAKGLAAADASGDESDEGEEGVETQLATDRYGNVHENEKNQAHKKGFVFAHPQIAQISDREAKLAKLKADAKEAARARKYMRANGHAFEYDFKPTPRVYGHRDGETRTERRAFVNKRVNEQSDDDNDDDDDDADMKREGAAHATQAVAAAPVRQTRATRAAAAAAAASGGDTEMNGDDDVAYVAEEDEEKAVSYAYGNVSILM
jgi:hypothetical protein